MLDVRVAQTTLENTLRDAILFAFGRRLPAVADAPALRAYATAGASGGTMRNDDDLICIVAGGVVVTAYRWSTISSAADDGAAVIKPNDVAGNGRWVAWTSPLRIQLAVGGNSQYLHEIASGPLQRVLVFDKSMQDDEFNNLLLGAVPAVVVEADGDKPEDTALNTGHRWTSTYDFHVYTLAQNLRERRQAAQGSPVPGEQVLGANAIDGLIMALLSGSQTSFVCDGIRTIQAGPASNGVSEMGQRRVVRQREYVVQATIENPAAPNDTGPAQQVSAQANLAQPAVGGGPLDLANCVTAGMGVNTSAGLSKPVRAGTAFIGGAPVTYAGESHTFAANSKTYRDLSPAGTMTFVATATEAAAPPVTSGSLRIGVTTTDGSNVVADTILAAQYVPYMNPFVTAL